MAPPARENKGPIKTSKLTTTRIPLGGGGEGRGNIQFHPLINISYHRDGERIGLASRGVGDISGVTPREGCDAGTDPGPTPQDWGQQVLGTLGMLQCLCQ